jgi:hypothetical protein
MREPHQLFKAAVDGLMKKCVVREVNEIVLAQECDFIGCGGVARSRRAPRQHSPREGRPFNVYARTAIGAARR